MMNSKTIAIMSVILMIGCAFIGCSVTSDDSVAVVNTGSPDAPLDSLITDAESIVNKTFYVRVGAYVHISSWYDQGGLDEFQYFIDGVTGGYGLTYLDNGSCPYGDNDGMGYCVHGNITTAGTIYVSGSWYDFNGNGNLNCTIIAVNNQYTHTITYNGNGATSGSVANTMVTDTNGGNSNVTLANNGFYKAGYTFGGWSVGGVTYQPGQAIPVGANATATAYAVWSQNTVSGTANNLTGLSGHSYTNQISAVASNNASFTFAVKSCSAGTASVNSAGLVTFNAPSVSATTNCNVVITVTAHYPDGQTKAADVAFTVSVDPVLVFTNSVTNGTLSIKGA